jgi:hypothetical protein
MIWAAGKSVRVFIGLSIAVWLSTVAQTHQDLLCARYVLFLQQNIQVMKGAQQQVSIAHDRKRWAFITKDMNSMSCQAFTDANKFCCQKKVTRSSSIKVTS